MDDFLNYLWNDFERHCSAYTRFVTVSASQSDNAAFRCDDEDNTKEEEVYQDLCAIQNSIARHRDQVFKIRLFWYLLLLYLHN